MLQQKHAAREHRRKDHAHRGTGFDAAQPAHGLDRPYRNHGSSSGPQQHRPGRDDTRQQEGHDNSRQHDMADGVANQSLLAQHQKITGQRAGNRHADADQHRGQGQRNKF